MNREVVSGGGASIYPLTGDIASKAGNTTVTVVGLQGIPVAQDFPTGGEVLTFDLASNTWIPTIPPSGITLETNGVTNSTQTLLNLQGSASVTITEAAGVVTFTAVAGGASRSATTTNANGSFWTWTDGIIEAWGSITVTSSGNAFNGATITFPTTFATAVQSLELTILGLPNSGSTDTADVQIQSISGSSAVINLQCNVPTGGGGTTFNQSVVVMWRAIGK